jgi:hypothetical protein
LAGKPSSFLSSSPCRIDETKTELSRRIDATNERLDVTNERLEGISRRLVDSEIRVATALTGMQGTLGDVVDLLRAP